MENSVKINNIKSNRACRKMFKPLILAIKNADYDLCEKIINENPNIINLKPQDKSPLFIAISNLKVDFGRDTSSKLDKTLNLLKIMDLLIENKANINGALLHSLKTDCIFAFLNLHKHFKYPYSLIKTIRLQAEQIISAPDNRSGIIDIIKLNWHKHHIATQLFYYYLNSITLERLENLLNYGLDLNDTFLYKKYNKTSSEQLITTLNDAIQKNWNLNLLAKFYSNVTLSPEINEKRKVELFAKNAIDLNKFKITLNKEDENLKSIILNDDIDKINSYSKSHLLSNFIDENTVLAFALKNKSNKVANKLINMGAKINSEVDDSDALLNHALSSNDINLANTLIEMGACVDTDNTLEKILNLNNLEILEKLLKGNSWNRTSPQTVFTLKKAIENNNDELFDLISDNLEVIFPSLLDKVVWSAVYSKSVYKLKKLLDCGANPNLLLLGQYSNILVSNDYNIIPKDIQSNMILTFLESGANITGTNLLYNLMHQISKNLFVDCLEFLFKNFGNHLLHLLNYTYQSYRNILNNALQSNGKEEDLVKFIKILIDYGFDVNKKDKYGQTPLFLAYVYDKKKAAQILLSQCKIDKKENEQLMLTAKLLSLVNGKEEVTPEQVIDLINKGADTTQEFNSLGVLSLALKNKHFNIIPTLIKNKVPQTSTDGYWINKAYLLNKEELDFLIDSIIDYAPLLSVELANYIISSNSNLENLQKLIDAGMDINKKANEFSPLLCACNENNINAAKLLIKNGAELNTLHKNSKGISFTPLMVAALKDNEEIIKLLIDSGVDVNQLNEEGNNAITILYDRKSHNEIICNTKSSYSFKGLPKPEDVIYSKDRLLKRKKIVILLLEAGTDPYHKNNEGHSLEYYNKGYFKDFLHASKDPEFKKKYLN